MRNMWLIIRREYLERVRTRSFLVLTLLLPAIMAMAFVLPLRLASMSVGRPEHLVLVVSSQRFGEVVRRQLLSQTPAPNEEDTGEQINNAGSSRAHYVIEVDAHATEDERGRLRAQLAAGTIDAYLWLTDDAIEAKRVTYTGRNMAGLLERSWIKDGLGRALVEQQLAARGLTSAQAE